MKKTTTILAAACAAVVVAGGVWSGAAAFHGMTPLTSAYAADTTKAAAADTASGDGDAKHGAYLARVGDCIACHTAKGGTPFAGGLAFPTPMGKIYSTNITPDKTHGIGGYSFDDFTKAMREGVGKQGHLYPAMPYTAYAKVSDADLKDLYAYFMTQVPASTQSNRASDIPWPLSMRWPLAVWDKFFLDTTRFNTVQGQSAEWNRGAYLVQGLAHCSTCHTPRGWAMQEVDVSGKSDRFLSGSQLDSSSPINLRGNPDTGLGNWSEADIVALLQSGRSPHTAVSGPMVEVVQNSTQYLSADDLKAIAVYVKSLSPAPQNGGTRFTASDATLQMFMSGQANETGARIYMDSCAACHRLNGQGQTRVFPSLANNPMVLHDNPDSLIAVILAGSRLPSTAAAPSDLAMPPFKWRYDDNEVAALATFVRGAWGNHAEAVTASEVAKIRKHQAEQ
ncbi:cytochrome c [Robbsia sp. KACC 23696]|uniref:cytochrome c n=1 Tax=Robbsia sp. KACC 23696 TaxID=3149231 RepID=UPI00325AD352